MEWDNRNRGGWKRGGPLDLMDLVSKAKKSFEEAGEGGSREGFFLARVVVIILIFL